MQTSSQKRDNIEKTILALLLARKEGCTLSQLSKDYNETEGEQIPWKTLGYHSLLNFVHSLSKTVQIEFWNNTPYVKGIASDKTKHVSELVAGQKCQKYPSGRKMHKPSFYYPTTPPPKILMPTDLLTRVIDMVNEYPDGVNKDYVLNYVQSQVPHVNIIMSDIEDQLRGLSHRIGQTNNKFFPIMSILKNGNSMPPIVTAGGDEDTDDIFNCDNGDDFAFIPSTSMPKSPCTTARTKSTSNFIQESVSKYQHEVAEYKTLEHTSIVQSDQNNLDIAHSYNDSVELEIHRESNNPEESIDEESNKENSSDNENIDIIVNQRVQFRLEKLIQNNPDGIWCADLPQKYLEEYKFSLNYTEYGFNSVREFASHLSNIFHCVQPYKTGDFMLYYAKREIPLNKSQEKQKVDNLAQLHYIYKTDNEVEALPSSLSHDTCKKIIPDGIVTIGETVGQLDVVELANAETPYIEIIVVEVFTPSFFWIQLRKKQKVFKVFMDDLHDFYTRNHEKYVMPPVLLERGLNCVCMYNGIWHRGIIKRVNPNLDVTVMFYDYGTLKTYPPEEIHYLHRMFSVLPAQAIPCGLVNTKPYIGSKWSASATHHFALRTSQAPLIATIASVNTEDNSMLIALTDTLEEEDVHINDWLVEKKLAQHGKMVCMKNRNFAFRYYLKCQECAKQKCNITEVSKIVKPIESTKSMVSENCSENKVTLYGSSADTISSLENNVKPCQTTNDQSQNFSTSDSSENNSSAKKIRNFNPNFKETPLIKLKMLCKKLSQIQQNSENSISSNNGNHEFNNNVTINGSSSSSLETNKKISGISSENEECDILKEYTNIPKIYAHHFCAQHSDELDLCYTEMCNTYNRYKEFKHVDWSAILKHGIQKKQYTPSQNLIERIHKSVPTKRDDEVPLAKSCFLKAVHKSVHFAADDKNIRWSPTGNINKIQDKSSLIFRNIQKLMANKTKKKVIAIPQKVLETLTEKKLFTENLELLTNILESTNEPESTSSSQCDNRLIADNPSCLTDDRIKNFPSNSVDDVSQSENYYLHIKPHTSKKKLLQILSMTQYVSSDTSDLDSDDLSVESFTSSRASINNCDEKSDAKEYENNASIDQSISNEFDLKINVKDLSYSTEIENVVINEQELSKNTSDTNESYEDPVLPETSVVAEKPTLIKTVLTQELRREPILIKSIITGGPLSEKSILKAQESMEETKETKDPFSVKKLTSTELIPMSELSSPDTINENSNIPVFNDIDMESDEEEWDVQMSFAGMHDFLRINHPLNKCIENHLNYKSDTCSQIEETNDSDLIEDTNNVHHNYQKRKSNIYEDVYSTNKITDDAERSSAESENIIDQYEEFIENQPSLMHKEMNLRTNSEDNFSTRRIKIHTC